jgi:hypothetical protein
VGIIFDLISLKEALDEAEVTNAINEVIANIDKNTRKMTSGIKITTKFEDNITMSDKKRKVGDAKIEIVTLFIN